MELTPGASGRLLVRYSDQNGAGGLTHYKRRRRQDWSLAWHGLGRSRLYRSSRRRRPRGDLPEQLLVKTDFGVTWQKLAAAPLYVHDFDFIDATTGWLLRAPTY